MARYKGKKTRFSISGPVDKVKSSLKPVISFNLLRNLRMPAFVESIIDFISRLFYKIKESRVLLAGILVGVIIAFITILVVDFFNVSALAHFKPNVTTKIYDKNNILISELFRQKREVVPFNKIPKHLTNAFIAMEDNEFYSHFGVNPKGIVRAFFVNIFSGRIKQGGSTITQQLAKILLTSRKRNIYRKIKEAFISLMIEAKYSKDEILSLYFNQIFLGHGAYGVESASKLYFDKHIWELSMAECALMSTLPSAPNRLSPIRYPKTSMQRHRIALAKMVEMGFLTKEEAEKSYLDFWPDYLDFISDRAPTVSTYSSRIDNAPWFTEYIRRKLINKYGSEKVYDKGLLVYTTLDINKQKAGKNVLKNRLQKQTYTSTGLAFKNVDYIIDNYSHTVALLSDLFGIEIFRKKGSRRSEKVNNYFQKKIVEELEGINYLVGYDNVDKFLDKYKNTYYRDKDFQKVEGCIISINQTNGYIEAMVGGSEFSTINQLNRPIQAYRQPGSSIKPLLYAAAIESGEFTPATTVLDSPVVYLDNDGGDWLPENYEGEFYGFVRIRDALIKSINVVSIRIADKLGIDYISKYYSKLLKFDAGTAKKRIPRNFSIALGSLEVSPFELSRAYAIIANGGRDVVPFSIRYIKDREGKILENREVDITKNLKERAENGTLQIIKAGTAQTMISLLSSVISVGTGSAASPGRPAAGKTGTTNNWKDAWFVGFTPQLTTGIWVGYDKMGLSLGPGQSGGSVAAPMWGAYMKEALKNEPVLSFPTYAKLYTIEVCKRTGLLPSMSCTQTINELFIDEKSVEIECALCSEVGINYELAKKGPRENISRKQKASMIKNFKKDDDDSIIDSIGDDLLQ